MFTQTSNPFQTNINTTSPNGDQTSLVIILAFLGIVGLIVFRIIRNKSKNQSLFIKLESG